MKAGNITIPYPNNSHPGKGTQHTHQHNTGKLLSSKAQKLRLLGNFLQKEGVKVKATKE
jgi:hypothetical protein